MEFWIFMLIMNLLIPLALVILGAYFRKNTPKNINHLFGYRTVRSMKNKDTWSFAHKYFGKVWIITGLILLPMAVVAMLPLLGKDNETVGIFGSVICVVEMIPLLISIALTENALKKNFNNDGTKKTK